MRQPRLNLVGCGRVGQTLARLWHVCGVFDIGDIAGNSSTSATKAAKFIGAGHAALSLAHMAPADVWMLAVPDSQISTVAAALARRCGHSAPATAFHCSGALPSRLLEPLQQLGWVVASAHPILSFADPQTAIAQFAGTLCGLEGDLAARTEIEAALCAIGGQCFEIAAEHKRLYHGAAVFCTNFPPVLQAIASTLWRETGVPPALVPTLMAALLRNSVDNIIALGPAAALTGPAARGDCAIIEAQAQALRDWDPLVADAYSALSALAMRLARSGTVRAMAPNDPARAISTTTITTTSTHTSRRPTP